MEGRNRDGFATLVAEKVEAYGPENDRIAQRPRPIARHATYGGVGLTVAPVRILVVEDDFLLAEELRSTLSSWGHEVVGLAGRGEAALSLAIETRPDLLISDVRLRDSINGVTVAEEVHRRLGTRVIFLTAYPAEALVSGRGWGARFLGKPYSEKELRGVIEEVMNEEPASGSSY